MTQTLATGTRRDGLTTAGSSHSRPLGPDLGDLARWWVPLDGIRPERVELRYLHAAVSTWFDQTSAEHRSGSKPYAISPLTRRGPQVGMEIGTLSVEASRRLLNSAGPGAAVRLGAQLGCVADEPIRLAAEHWSELRATPATEWALDFDTPVIFRREERSTPLPTSQSILRSLSYHWNVWSGLAEIRLGWQELDAVWVSDIAGSSHPVKVGLAHGRGREQTHRGFLGRVTLRCGDKTLAGFVGRLLAVAPYAGVGSFTTRGLGVTRVTSSRQGRRGNAR